MHKFILTIAIIATLGACTTEQPPEYLTDTSPVDATQGIQNVHHHSGLGTYVDRRPVEPRSWKTVNDEQSPAKEKK